MESIAVIFWSGTGNTATMAQEVVAGTGGQGRAHHSAVCRAFAGRHGSGSGQAARFNGCNGCFHGVPLFRAVQASNVVSNACTAVSTVFSRRPVLSTAASDAAR